MKLTTKIKKSFFGLLNWLRITDDNGVLSLTNVFIIIILVKIAVAPTLNMEEIATLFIAFSNYIYKKHIGKDKEE